MQYQYVVRNARGMIESKHKTEENAKKAAERHLRSHGRGYSCMVVKLKENLARYEYAWLDDMEVLWYAYNVANRLKWFNDQGKPCLVHLPEDVREIAASLLNGDPGIIDALRDVLERGG